jgi:hypothetical protein
LLHFVKYVQISLYLFLVCSILCLHSQQDERWVSKIETISH